MTTTKTPVHTLYRFFDNVGTLLYIGRTVDARSRFRSHERSKDWFDAVARVERDVYPDAETLALAEVSAIQNERPLHNVAHSTRPKSEVKTKPISVDDETDPRVLRRLAATSELYGEEPQVEPCGDNAYDGGCRCSGCVRTVLSDLDRHREERDLDEPLMGMLTELERQYLRGAEVVDWLYDLDDTVLFRRFALIEHSKKYGPAPALANMTEEGLVDSTCWFCLGCHQSFPAPGAGVRPVEAPCLGNGLYFPIFDLDAFSDRSYFWHKEVAA